MYLIHFTSCLQNTRDTHLTPDAKPQPSVTVADSGVTPGVLPVTVFGPIKKFRPVICRSVEKETSLHSSLMEAIQTGGGKDRLKKVRLYSTGDGWVGGWVGRREIIMPSENYGEGSTPLPGVKILHYILNFTILFKC